MKEDQTKCNELVQQGSKSHTASTTVSSSSYNKSHMLTLVLRTQRGQLSSQSNQRLKQETFRKSLKICTLGVMHQKTFKLMKAIVPKGSSLEGISNESPPCPTSKPKCNTQE